MAVYTERWLEANRQSMEARRQPILEQQKKVFKKIRDEKDALKAQLVAPGEIESLVRSGRVPFFVDFTVSPKLDLAGRILGERANRVFCFVPPEGTQFGDHIRRFSVGIYSFTSPDGVVRGAAAIYDFSPEEARELKLKIDASLKSLGRG